MSRARRHQREATPSAEPETPAQSEMVTAEPKAEPEAETKQEEAPEPPVPSATLRAKVKGPGSVRVDGRVFGAGKLLTMSRADFESLGDNLEEVP